MNLDKEYLAEANPKRSWADLKRLGSVGSAILRIPRNRVLMCYATMRQKYFDKFVFIHINKCGGTSIERALGIPVLNHDTAMYRLKKIGKKRWDACWKFAFVRNPFDKVVSHYEYRRLTNQTDMGTCPISFDEWVELAYADKNTRYYDKQKMFMPQKEWITNEEDEIIVDFVGRFESIRKDFQVVCEALDLNTTLPHVKSTRRRQHFRSYYSQRSRAIIENHFRVDLEQFGYEF